VAARLVARYGVFPDEGLPILDQLVWFLLSTRTTVENCDAAYAALRARYPDWEAAAGAAAPELGDCLRPAGLWRTRADNLLGSLATIRSRFGAATLEPLRGWPDEDCEAFLLSLPGVGLKVARCVLSFGLRRRSFAVDVHIWRVTRRLGWHDEAGEAPSARGADLLQALVPEGLDAVSLHVNLIRLGREFCGPRGPDCGRCPLSRLCPRRGAGGPAQRADGAGGARPRSPRAKMAQSDSTKGKTRSS